MEPPRPEILLASGLPFQDSPESPPQSRHAAAKRDLLIALNAAADLGRTAICRLARGLDAWAFDPPRELTPLAQALGVAVSQIEKARRLSATASSVARRETAETHKQGGTILTLLDPQYPSCLFDLALPPPVLYFCGELPHQPGVAVVGPRNMDPYGSQAARFFARGLAAEGLVVVSGFARGVDAVAHRSALEVAGGKTVAVLGCGLGVDYPKQHSQLFAEVRRNGAVVTEFPCHRPPQPWQFPVRNRLIAALSEGTLVIQASHRSGSLITARHALDLGREVWAVPGRIFDARSAGGNALIRDGAHLVESPRDIVESLPLAVRDRLGPNQPLAASTARHPARSPQAAQKLLAALAPGQTSTPEEISTLSGIPAEEVLSLLLELELGGRVERHPGPCFSRLR